MRCVWTCLRHDLKPQPFWTQRHWQYGSKRPKRCRCISTWSSAQPFGTWPIGRKRPTAGRAKMLKNQPSLWSETWVVSWFPSCSHLKMFISWLKLWTHHFFVCFWRTPKASRWAFFIRCLLWFRFLLQDFQWPFNLGHWFGWLSWEA